MSFLTIRKRTPMGTDSTNAPGNSHAMPSNGSNWNFQVFHAPVMASSQNPLRHPDVMAAYSDAANTLSFTICHPIADRKTIHRMTGGIMLTIFMRYIPVPA